MSEHVSLSFALFTDSRQCESNIHKSTGQTSQSDNRFRLCSAPRMSRTAANRRTPTLLNDLDESNSVNSDVFRSKTTANHPNYQPNNPTIFDGWVAQAPSKQRGGRARGRRKRKKEQTERQTNDDADWSRRWFERKESEGEKNKNAEKEKESERERCSLVSLAFFKTERTLRRLSFFFQKAQR